MPQPTPISPKHAEEAVRVAREILARSVTMIEGARKMADIHLYSSHMSQPRDEAYALFLEIDSQSSHLPVGEVRKYWSAEVLARKDAEIEALTASFQEQGMKAAQTLIHRYGNLA